MTCRWYEAKLEDPAVELWQHGLPSPLLRAHARECPDCTQLLQQESQLADMLRELATSTSTLEPSGNVKDILVAYLAELRRERMSRVWTLRFAFACGALVLFAFVGLIVLKSEHLAQPHTVAEPSVETSHMAVQSQLPATQTQRPSKPQTNSRVPTVSPSSKAADYYPVVMCDSLECSGPTMEVRVEVPASPLVRRNDPNRKVMADLLVGEDGIVRGVRVLQ